MSVRRPSSVTADLSGRSVYILYFRPAIDAQKIRSFLSRKVHWMTLQWCRSEFVWRSLSRGELLPRLCTSSNNTWRTARGCLEGARMMNDQTRRTGAASAFKRNSRSQTDKSCRKAAKRHEHFLSGGLAGGWGWRRLPVLELLASSTLQNPKSVTKGSSLLFVLLICFRCSFEFYLFFFPYFYLFICGSNK